LRLALTLPVLCCRTVSDLSLYMRCVKKQLPEKYLATGPFIGIALNLKGMAE